jgi:uncharacterized membrane protein YuzA (DUF378 family)
MCSATKRGFAIAILLLVVGGFNWGWKAIKGKDFVTAVLGKYAWIVFALVGIAALYIAFARDTYLPFLGPSVMPCSLLKEQTPEGADVEVRVRVEPGAKVLYWAAEPENDTLDKLKDWRQAYLGFMNAGVTTADSQGLAILKVRDPQPYYVPVYGRLESHVHFRVCKEKGMIGRVETKLIRASEPFADMLPTVKKDMGAAAAAAATAAATATEGFEDAAEEPENETVNLPDPDYDTEGFANEEIAVFTPPAIPDKSVREPSKHLEQIAESTEKDMLPLTGSGAPLDTAFTQIH